MYGGSGCSLNMFLTIKIRRNEIQIQVIYNYLLNYRNWNYYKLLPYGN